MEPYLMQQAVYISARDALKWLEPWKVSSFHCLSNSFPSEQTKQSESLLRQADHQRGRNPGAIT